MDLTREVIYRNFTLNPDMEDMQAAYVGGGGYGSGMVGCVLDAVDMSDVDVVQFLEKRSQGDGMDANDPHLGARRIMLAGTLYNVSRNLLYDDVMTLRAVMNPVLAAREDLTSYGYLPLYFSVPTNREEYGEGAIELMMRAMPRAFAANFQRDNQGGEDTDALAVPWQATMVCRDPGIYAAEPIDIEHTAQTEVTGATIATNNLVTKASHGLSAGDRVTFTSLTGGTGLSTGTAYYVISSGLTSDAFKVSLTSGGSEVDVTVAYTDADYVKSVTDSGDILNRGTYLASLNALWVVGAAAGSIYAVIGDSHFHINIPASTGDRIIRFKGQDKVLTFEEDEVEVPKMSALVFDDDTTWPLIDPGSSSYSFTFHGGILESGSHSWFYEQYA